ncbi:hypothetical protein ACIHCQ_35915 [Streptomyces sp. NPDC052236]|uniref:hypothetical protein n=1 Tax=Streptomyces sp. NPDC052236 TaxID=3365686 RepID=UPI0037CF7146
MDAVTADFRLEEQHDAYQHALEQLVAARLEDQEPPHAPDTVPIEGSGTVDLMAALEQSVKAAKSRRSPAAVQPRRRLRGPRVDLRRASVRVGGTAAGSPGAAQR